MRSSNHITLLRGGHEEYLEEITDAWPHVLEYVELDRYPHRSCTWHWHQEVELFYFKSGSLEYQTLRGRESFGAGSAGFANAGVYHMTWATDDPRPLPRARRGRGRCSGGLRERARLLPHV